MHFRHTQMGPSRTAKESLQYFGQGSSTADEFKQGP